MQAAAYLVRNDIPFCSLVELAEHAREFAAFLSQHRDYLVQYGLPPRYFDRCPWLHVQLGRLYDTRTTTSPYPYDQLFRYETARSRVDQTQPYTWYRTPQGRGYSLSEVKHCPYIEADLLTGMQPDDAEQIEHDRAKLFGVKSSIVRRLSEASAESTDPDALWNTCLGELVNVFDSRDIEFYLRMDRWYLGRRQDPGHGSAWSPKWSPGGLTNLLEVIGRFEAELNLASRDPRGQADNAVLRTTLLKVLSERKNPQWVYFSLLDSPERDRLDRALDAFTARMRGNQPFWIDFGRRLESTLTPEEPASVLIELPRKHAEVLGPLLQRQALYMAEKIGGGELDKFLTPPPYQPTFRLDGNSWTIAFEDKQIPKLDSIGLRYIFLLLAEPRKKFTPHNLVVVARKIGGDLPENETLREEGLELASDSLGEVFDDVTLEECEDAIERQRKKLEELVEVEIADSQSPEASTLQSQITKLEKYIADGSGQFGRMKEFADRGKKEKKAVALAFKRTYADLEKAHRVLNRHLKASIKETDLGYSYEPDPPVDWILENISSSDTVCR
jgi:hypothetical protein